MIARKPYPSDLSDPQWARIASLIPPAKPGGRERTVEVREVVNALLYHTRAGGDWRMLPHDFPPWQTVYYYFRRWENEGVWERIHDTLREQVRVRAGRQPTPSAAIIDSQSVKTTEHGGPRGYDGAKKVTGRKRHILVDTMGLILAVVVHVASIADRDGALPVLAGIRERFHRLRLVWADGGYTGELKKWLGEQSLIRLELVKKPSRWVWVAQGEEPPPYPKGFQVLKRRWVVARTFGWLGRYRRLAKDYERLPRCSEAFIYLAMIHLMLRRLDRTDSS